MLLGDYSDNSTELYDYIESMDWEPLNATAIDPRSGRTSSVGPDQNTSSLNEELSETEIPYWAFPTLPTIAEKENTGQRIVGGDEALPGEIPWQVQLNPHLQSSGGRILLQESAPFRSF